MGQRRGQRDPPWMGQGSGDRRPSMEKAGRGRGDPPSTEWVRQGNRGPRRGQGNGAPSIKRAGLDGKGRRDR